MDKTFLAFVIIGVAFLYFVTNFVGGIQKEDETYSNNDYALEHKYDQYNSVDSVGQNILNFIGADMPTQIAAWNASPLKQEFLALFPDFGDMKHFVKDRIVGKAFQEKLLKKIKDVEDGFFSGKISAEQAKKELDLLK